MMAPALLLQTASVPTEFGTPLLIAMLFGVAGYAVRAMEGRCKRGEDCCDSCRTELRENTKLMAEQTAAFRELKDAVLGRR